MTKLWARLDEILTHTVSALYNNERFRVLLNAKDYPLESVREKYGYFLEQTYTYVINTHRFLTAARDTISRHPDPFFNMTLKNRLGQHAKEEARHEEWLINDYVALGKNRECIIDARPNPAMAAYNAYNEFLTSCPTEVVGIFGVSALLEGVAFRLGRLMANELSPLFGKNAVSFIWRHGATDEKHTEELAIVCGHIETHAENDCQRVLDAASLTSRLYINLMSYFD